MAIKKRLFHACTKQPMEVKSKQKYYCCNKLKLDQYGDAEI